MKKHFLIFPIALAGSVLLLGTVSAQLPTAPTKSETSVTPIPIHEKNTPVSSDKKADDATDSKDLTVVINDSVTSIPSDDIDSVTDIALHSRGHIATIGRVTQGVLYKGPKNQIISYVSIYDDKGRVVNDFYSNASGDTEFRGISFDNKGEKLWLLGDGSDIPKGVKGKDIFLVSFSEKGKPSAPIIINKGSWKVDSQDRASKLAIDTKDNIYVLLNTSASYPKMTPLKSQDVLLLKYSPKGKLIWRCYMGTSQKDEATGLAVGYNNTIAVTYNAVDDMNKPTGILQKVPKNGCKSKLKSEAIFKLGGVKLENVDIDFDESIIISGQSYSETGNVGLVRKYDANNKKLWEKHLQGENINTVTNSTVGVDGRIYIGGIVDKEGEQNSAIVRYNKDGTGKRVQLFSSSGQDRISSLNISANGNLWMGGHTFVNSQEWKGWLMQMDKDMQGAKSVKLQEITFKGAPLKRKGLF